MKGIALIPVFILGLTFFMKTSAQIVDTPNNKICQLKVKTITQTVIFVPDSAARDTFPETKEFYNAMGQIIEKRYDYRRRSLNSKEWIYATTMYFYNKDYELIRTSTTGQGFSDFNIYDTPKTIYQNECKYFDEAGNLIKAESLRDDGAKEASIFTYQEFKIKDDPKGRTLKLPTQINSYFDHSATDRTIIEYTFY
jgi:hypothetical protein